MTAAIETLLIRLEALENNESIYRKNGDIKEADVCLSAAAEIKEALRKLGHKLPLEIEAWVSFYSDGSVCSITTSDMTDHEGWEKRKFVEVK